MVPFIENATVNANKITGYLLNTAHSEGGPKAKFFISMGFSIYAIAAFQNALLTHLKDRICVSETADEWGTRYVMQCNIETPNGRNPCITSVWMIDAGSTQPRFITAYPNG